MSQFPSQKIQISQSWKGSDSLKFLVIFGDSYSAVGYDFASHVPTTEEPLGIPFPGETYTEPSTPNWVGHFITTCAVENKWVVFDYAVGGASVHDVWHQVKFCFKDDIADASSKADWATENTLFVTWVGINDSAWTSEHGGNMKKLLSAQEELYNWGARNFLFINVPAIDRAPAQGIAENYVGWNTELTKSAASFAATHSDCTVLLFSAWDTFNALLDDPVGHGFCKGDESKAYSSVWTDMLHPTSRVHDFVALDVVEFLREVERSS
ncbi:Lipase-GDSL domain-containing protein [Mycena indigotica]|uniref:Lipase-GDSL domain-containing protein n=1 Tax=Mycena indigotica TaxID=2126181 RepID=A0A8H6SSQ5_9AGAR|nr:Lipase-GDSL domain-containing protein [Mycena indigotica]KAF7303687.1 Lipase-GDSL domain-containing protein [Mycena indigotica]